ncbi:MAG: hypothetical protein ACR2NL_03935 [Acidimicrobiia bacterium]
MIVETPFDFTHSARGETRTHTPDVEAAVEQCQAIFADLGFPGFGG